MESARTYTLRIILISAFFFCIGFLFGWNGVNLFSFRSPKKSNLYLMGANTTMAKRMQAIKEAQKQGRDDYGFEVSGFHPILGKN